MNPKKLSAILGRVVNACFAVFPESHMIQTTHTEAYSETLPPEFDGFRMVQISDLHGRTFGTRLLRRVRAERPEIIVLTGDLVDHKTRCFGGVLGFIAELCRLCPVCFVSGNHEIGLPEERRAEFLRGLAKAGVEILDNRSRELCRGGAAVRLCGLRLPLRYYRSAMNAKPCPALTPKEIERHIGKKTAAYTVLLAHNPLCFDAYAAWGAELTLCGHVHGGMVRLPGLGGLLSPERRFFPKYSAGAYFSGKNEMIVSRGLAGGPRIGNLPELGVIVLRAGKRP